METPIWLCISPECQEMLRPFLSPDFIVPREGATPWTAGLGNPYKDLEATEEIDKIMREKPRNLRHIE